MIFHQNIRFLYSYVNLSIHIFYVDKVDNFVYNSILQGFPPFQNVENFCTEICAIHIFRQALCNVSKIRLFEIRSDSERCLIIVIRYFNSCCRGTCMDNFSVTNIQRHVSAPAVTVKHQVPFFNIFDIFFTDA